eukprot:SAG25_NODE_338_length_9538_cov_22.622630_4_plen_142_part_00
MGSSANLSTARADNDSDTSNESQEVDAFDYPSSTSSDEDDDDGLGERQPLLSQGRGGDGRSAQERDYGGGAPDEKSSVILPRTLLAHPAWTSVYIKMLRRRRDVVRSLRPLLYYVGVHAPPTREPSRARVRLGRKSGCSGV